MNKYSVKSKCNKLHEIGNSKNIALRKDLLILEDKIIPRKTRIGKKPRGKSDRKQC